MKRLGFNTVFAVVLSLIFVAVVLWQIPGLVGGRLTKDEIARYLVQIERQVPLPPDEKPAVLAHVRAFAEADDGKPFYMLNLMRYHDKLRMFPGAPTFSGSPREANALYEHATIPLAVKRGAFPIFAGETHGANVMGFGPGQDGWSRVMLVRYPSRRAILDLLTDPAYGPIEPYKLMALEVVLAPTWAELVFPPFWVAAGAVLLLIFLATGWARAASSRD